MAKEDFRPSEVIVPMNLNNVNLTKFYGLIQREEENQKLTVEMMIEAAGEYNLSYRYCMALGSCCFQPQ